MTEMGEAPTDNPFADAPYVYSYGHRNPQGLIVDAPTQTIWMTEHGPGGGDEPTKLARAGTMGGLRLPTVSLPVAPSPFTEAPV